MYFLSSGVKGLRESMVTFKFHSGIPVMVLRVLFMNLLVFVALFSMWSFGMSWVWMM